MSTCVSCHNPLVLTLQPDIHSNASSNSSIATVPDDVLLSCACHFHWQCLLDAYNITRCPNCDQSISTTYQEQESILVTLYNEGGLQHNLDILPLLVEESYLKAYPEERKARAFLEFVREGDAEAVVDLIRASAQNDEDEDEGVDGDGDDGMEEEEDDEEEDDVPQMSVASILRYQDLLDEGRTALHIAVAKGNGEIVWLMLLLASNLELDAFPEQVQQVAAQLDIGRESQEGLVDVRTIRDADGRTAYDLVAGSGMIGFDTALLRPS
ncbi:MAG: hypothetical protein GOMPHAMPRED_006950 [Gomphillus americanus]|uniref:Uncharacterized protein n=1 Tax=Gomphillus americanus TaxID=1940652 RepID=A0A8H3I7B3_9LECA|nr:MAG: hypothetical protein GOMPHAMPRED_006950 [Gomphillus americanus]